MEPAPAKSSTNRVPVVFQGYPKIQQLYPLYPVYAGARGAGPERPPKPKGLDLLQDQQFDTRNPHLSDTGIAKKKQQKTLSFTASIFNNSLRVSYMC